MYKRQQEDDTVVPDAPSSFNQAYLLTMDQFPAGLTPPFKEQATRGEAELVYVPQGCDPNYNDFLSEAMGWDASHQAHKRQWRVITGYCGRCKASKKNTTSCEETNPPCRLCSAGDGTWCTFAVGDLANAGQASEYFIVFGKPTGLPLFAPPPTQPHPSTTTPTLPSSNPT